MPCVSTARRQAWRRPEHVSKQAPGSNSGPESPVDSHGPQLNQIQAEWPSDVGGICTTSWGHSLLHTELLDFVSA